MFLTFNSICFIWLNLKEVYLFFNYYSFPRLKIQWHSIQMINSLGLACLPDISLKHFNFSQHSLPQLGTSFHLPLSISPQRPASSKPSLSPASLSMEIPSPLNSCHTLSLLHDFPDAPFRFCGNMIAFLIASAKLQTLKTKHLFLNWISILPCIYFTLSNSV